MLKLFIPLNVLHKTIVISVFCSCYFLSYCQEDWYYQSMYNTIQTIDTAKNTARLKQCSVFFYRTWETNPADWLPAYYYTLTLLKCAEFSSIQQDQNTYLSKAEDYSQQSFPGFNYNCETEILQARYCLLKVKLQSDTAALKKAAWHLERSFQLDNNNPRAYLIMAEYVYLKYNKTETGQVKAIEWLDKALKLYPIVSEKKNLKPSWGKTEAENMLAKITIEKP
jgi:hypothetical protein